jgi:hypothetical protein
MLPNAKLELLRAARVASKKQSSPVCTGAKRVFTAVASIELKAKEEATNE